MNTSFWKPFSTTQHENWTLVCWWQADFFLSCETIFNSCTFTNDSNYWTFKTIRLVDYQPVSVKL